MSDIILPHDTSLLKAVFAQRLIAWQKQYGRHELPWQKSRSPYHVWLSEIMLQQTQVVSVMAYFDRFIGLFPTVEHLAKASSDQVMAAWAGLGYYARARHLHRTAQIIAYDRHGHFPKTRLEWMQFPGVGRSTAAAIVAFTEGQIEAILDGNVKRVLARYFALDIPVNGHKIEALWALAEELLPKQDIQNYTQGLMDLGALICTPKRPQCAQCPLVSSCRSHAEQLTHLYPKRVALRQKKKEVLQHHLLIFDSKRQKLLLQKRSNAGIWGGLWALPERGRDGFSDAGFPAHEPVDGDWPVIQHMLTHRVLQLHFEVILLLDEWHSPNAQLIWYDWATLNTVGMPAPFRSFFNSLQGKSCQIEPFFATN